MNNTAEAPSQTKVQGDLKMTYPKMKTATVTFVAERTNKQFRSWMPLYEDTIHPSLWENEAKCEDEMGEAHMNRMDTFNAEIDSVKVLTGISIGIAMTELALGTLGETRKGAVEHIDRIITQAERVLEKAGYDSLTRTTVRYTRREWGRIYPNSTPNERWVEAEAKQLEAMAGDWIAAQVADLVWQALPHSIKNGIDD